MHSDFHPSRTLALAAALFVALAAGHDAGAISQSTPATPKQPPAAPAAGTAAAQAPIDPSAPATRPADDVLAAITREGRRIASYHEAIAKTRERIAATRPDLLDRARMFVVERAGVWRVLVVGREVDGSDTRGWLLRADATFQPKAGEVARLDLIEPPRPAPNDAQATMRALDTALNAAQAHAKEYRPPYDEAIFRIPVKPGGFVVYLQSRSGAQGFARTGADMKGGVSADGTRITEFAPMHGPGEAIDVPPGEGAAPTLHSHATVDLPTATDVAAVIDQPGVAPHLVLTPHWMFRITADGAITWLGPNAVPPATPGGGS